MKNCPWFSLRSNSIESRFRSIRWGNFLANTYVKLRKNKSNSEFASLINHLCSLRSIMEPSSYSRFARLISFKCERELCNQGKSEGEILILLNRSWTLARLMLFRITKKRTKRTECERYNDRSLISIPDYRFFNWIFKNRDVWCRIYFKYGLILRWFALVCAGLRFKAVYVGLLVNPREVA